MTEEEVENWNSELRSIARKWAFRWAWRQHQQPLVEDLVAVGWVTLLKVGPSHPLIRLKIQDAMQLALAHLVFGNKRPWRRPWLVTTLVPIDEVKDMFASKQPSPYKLVEQRQVIERIWQALPSDCRRLWILMAMDLHYGQGSGGKFRWLTARPAVLCRGQGWTEKQIYLRRRRLQQIAAAVVQEHQNV